MKASLYESYRTLANKEAVLNRCESTCHDYFPRAQCRASKGKSPSPSLSLEGEVHTLQAAAGGVWLLISTHQGAGCDFLQSQKELVGTSLAFSFWFTSTIKPTHQYLLGRSFFIYLAPNFYGCYPKDQPSNYLAQIANTACIHESHKTIANKKFLNLHRTNSHPHGLYTQAQCRRNRRMFPCHSFFMEGSSFQSAYIQRLPIILTLGTLTVLGTHSPTGSH